MTSPMRTGQSRWRRYLKLALWTAAATIAAFYLVVFVYIDVNQDQLTFPARSNYPKDTPASAGLAFEDVHIHLNASEQIHAWYVPAAPASSKVILFFHGNGYTIESSVSGELTDLHQTGANVLMAEYRGYGSSSAGQENGFRAIEDGRAALRYLTEQRHISAQDIFIVGRSIGTGVAAQLAFENPRAAGLVLLSPFTNLNAAARQVYPIMRFLQLELMGSRNKLPTIERIGAIRMPVLIVVGSEDDLTPPWMAERLMHEANKPKKLFLVSGAGHNDLWEAGGQSLVKELTSFIASTGSAPPPTQAN
jgi:uncharacterized protein